MVVFFLNSPLRLALSILVVLSAVSNFVNGIDAAGSNKITQCLQKESPTLSLFLGYVKTLSGFPFDDNDTVKERIKVPKCYLKTDTCSLKSKYISNEYNTVIYPGYDHDTQCINSSTPFYFQVFPGSGKGLLIYFAGGGGCWKDKTCELGSCYGGKVLAATSPKIIQEPYEGIFNKADLRNPFRTYTIVSISYCSGDLHSGNVHTMYENIEKGGAPVHVRQAGRNNTMSTLAWVLKNIPHPDRLVVMGCSAGALAAQLWGGYIAERYKFSGHEVQTTVIADSYAGIFPSSQSLLIQYLDILKAPFMAQIPDCVREKMEKSGVYLCELLDVLHKLHQKVTYLSIQSKADIVQHLFHIAVATSLTDVNLNDTKIPECARRSIPDPARTHFTPGLFTDALTGLYNTFESTPNFAPYLINSLYHCYTCFDRFYNTTINVGDDKQILLVDWIRQVSQPTWIPRNGVKGLCEIGDHYTNPNGFTLIQIGYSICPFYTLE